jgi:bifunctional DNA-binding transcriptional regulator/antitoxin component of YhaV-PrlF toxin-antitoxin module
LTLSSAVSDHQITLTVTARGQVKFGKDVLQHPGIRPGERIELDKLPDGQVLHHCDEALFRKARQFLGMLAWQNQKRLRPGQDQ